MIWSDETNQTLSLSQTSHHLFNMFHIIGCINNINTHNWQENHSNVRANILHMPVSPLSRSGCQSGAVCNRCCVWRWMPIKLEPRWCPRMLYCASQRAVTQGLASETLGGGRQYLYNRRSTKHPGWSNWAEIKDCEDGMKVIPPSMLSFFTCLYEFFLLWHKVHQEFAFV